MCIEKICFVTVGIFFVQVVVQFRLSEKILLSQIIDVLQNSLVTDQAHE